jgi:hypothetical protein
MDCERRLSIPHSAVIPPSTNSRPEELRREDEATCALSSAKVRFAQDSPLEQDGFEPSVPLAKVSAPAAEGEMPKRSKGRPREGLRGTIPWLRGNISYHAADHAVLLSTTTLKVEIGAQPTASISPATEGGQVRTRLDGGEGWRPAVAADYDGRLTTDRAGRRGRCGRGARPAYR